MKKTIAIDADGVLYDLLTPWVKAYNDIFDDDLDPNNITSYDISKFTKCDRDSLMYILEREDFWDSIKLYNGVYEAIELLTQKEDIDLVIATATGYKTAVPKFEKIFSLLPMLKKEQLIMIGRKDLLDVDILIDDWEQNLKKMACSLSKTPILITQPYNRSFTNYEYGILRFDNLAKAVDYILNYVERLNYYNGTKGE